MADIEQHARYRFRGAFPKAPDPAPVWILPLWLAMAPFFYPTPLPMVVIIVCLAVCAAALVCLVYRALMRWARRTVVRIHDRGITLRNQHGIHCVPADHIQEVILNDNFQMWFFTDEADGFITFASDSDGIALALKAAGVETRPAATEPDLARLVRNCRH